MFPQINRHSHPRVKWSMCFAHFLKVSCYGQVSDVCILKRNSHPLDWGHQGSMQQQCPEYPFPLCNKLRSHRLMLVLVTTDPVKTVSSNSFRLELLTGGASYSHDSWTKADGLPWAAGSISRRWKCLIQCFLGEEEAKPSPCKHPITCCVLEYEDACSLQPSRERTKQLVRYVEDSPPFLRLPQPRGTGVHTLLHSSPPVLCKWVERFANLFFHPN